MFPLLLNFTWIKIYSYPLFMGMAFGFSYHLIVYYLEKDKISKKGFRGLFWGMTLFSWIGAKLFFLYNSVQNEIVFEVIQNTNFWFGGGFVFYGGLIFGAIYLFIYTLIFKKFSIIHCDRFPMALTFGHAIGRFGCFMAGCCYGHLYDGPIAIYLHGHNRHPVQLYESISLVILGIIMHSVFKTRQKIDQLFIYVFGYGGIRFITEFYRGDFVRGFYFNNLSRSQIISLLMISFGLFFIIFFRRFSPEKI